MYYGFHESVCVIPRSSYGSDGNPLQNCLPSLLNIDVDVSSKGADTFIREDSLAILPMFEALIDMGVGVSYHGAPTALRG